MILLVDDNQVQLGTRRVILERAGYSVVTAENGFAGLKVLAERQVEMTITDHLMPGMNGVEFVTQLRRLDETMPVLVISGMPDAQDDYLDLNVEVALKPCAPEFLLARVGAVYAPRLSRTA